MPRKKKVGTPTIDPRDQLIADLQKTLETMSVNASAQSMRLQQVSPHTYASNEAYVGIRNISDNTIGIKGMFGQPDLLLHGETGHNDPGSVASIPHAWWMRLRQDKIVVQGQLIRDDSILGQGSVAAPADRYEDISQQARDNQILDPEQWIWDRDEETLKRDIAKVNSQQSLRRIRRGVDLALKRIENRVSDPNEPPNTKAWDELPMKFRLVDELTTTRLERPKE